MVPGVFAVAAAYLLCNVAYMSVLPLETIKTSQCIGLDFAKAVGGDSNALQWVIAGGVAISTLGSCHGSILTGSRQFYASARAGRFLPVFATLTKQGVPGNALVGQAAVATILLVLPGAGFGSFLSYMGGASWLFYGTTSYAAIRLRRLRPDAPRPFRVPCYPVPPAITAATSACIVVSNLVGSPLYASLALMFVALSFPVHWWLYERGGAGGRASAGSGGADERANPLRGESDDVGLLS